MMVKSETITKLISALAKAQAEFPAIPRDRTVQVRTKSGATYTFAYAPLDTIMEKIRPTLKANGLAFMQSVNGEALTTTLIHSSGEWWTSEPLPIRVSDPGPQAFGSAITYARRYALTAMLGLVTEEDDDGNAAEGNEARAAPRKSIPANAGAGDDLSSEQRRMVEKTRDGVVQALQDGKDWDAYALCESLTDEMVSEKLYLWLLLNSTQRSRIKKQAEIAKKQTLAEQA